MPAYQYKDEEQKARHLAYRRAYYAKNRERIRARDNATARKNRKARPEQYAKYTAKFNDKKKREEMALKPSVVSFEDNPDRRRIMTELTREVT